MQIKIELPGVKVGIVEADGVRIEPSNEELVRLIDATCERRRTQFTVETLAEAAPVREVRGMFRGWGMDPSKYRPSSEALLRRVVQGKGLYLISNVVDLANLGSVETGWPYGCYDLAKLGPPVVLRHGTAGESYERVGKEMWHLEGRPTLADADGPFGSPISDSTRTMITEATRSALVVIYAPLGARNEAVGEAMERLSQRLSQFGHASAARTFSQPGTQG
jgi:DNA/RNA-binding domain of Phe-tRNA-synthetase-like protein